MQRCIICGRSGRSGRSTPSPSLRYGDVPGVLVAELEGNLTHEELEQALPADEPRLVVHELCLAGPDGTRRNALLLIFWMPPDAGEQEETYTAGYSALKDLSDVHVHLTARRAGQLEYRSLVAMAS